MDLVCFLLLTIATSSKMLCGELWAITWKDKDILVLPIKVAKLYKLASNQKTTPPKNLTTTTSPPTIAFNIKLSLHTEWFRRWAEMQNK